jgi:hypothetical protein
MPIPADRTAELQRWLAALPRERIEAFVADPTTALDDGLEWVRPMLRTNEERVLRALAMLELRERDASHSRRERRREEARWAITTLVALASLATSLAVVLRG